MNEREAALYRRLRFVHNERSLSAAKDAVTRQALARFHAENDARRAQTARLEPAHEAMRTALAASKQFAGVHAALATARHRPDRLRATGPSVPAGPTAPRFTLGSAHLVDTPPFLAFTGQAISVDGGPSDPSPPQPAADGTTGDMSVAVDGGFTSAGDSNNSSMSSWAYIGQTYSVPPDIAKQEPGGSMVRFSAAPSFNWQANWSSNLWRLAQGAIWIGQQVDQFDENGVYLATPVYTYSTLVSWNDYNFSDFHTPSGSNTAYGLSTYVSAFPFPPVAFPNCLYNCWVWIQGYAYGDAIDSGASDSYASISANVGALIFDTF